MSEMFERIQALEAAVNALEAKLGIEPEVKESKPWEPWKPEVGQEYFCVIGYGSIERSTWDDGWYDRSCRNFNNCRATEAAAERHALRLRSMRPTCPVPKVGDKVWVVYAELYQLYAGGETWNESFFQRVLYNEGRVFTTSKAAEAWIAEFGDAWTTLEDEAK